MYCQVPNLYFFFITDVFSLSLCDVLNILTGIQFITSLCAVNNEGSVHMPGNVQTNL